MQTTVLRDLDPYSDSDPWVHANRERLYEAIANETHVEKDGWILDAGCSDGSFASHLRNSHGLMVGADLSLTDLKVGRNKARWFPILCHSLDLPFRDSTFDLVLSKDMLHHLDDPQGGVRELLRILKPSRNLVVIEANRVNPVMTLFTRYGRHNHFTSKSLLSLLQKAGNPSIELSQVEAHPYYPIFRPSRNPILFLWDAVWFGFMRTVKLFPKVVLPIMSLENLTGRIWSKYRVASFNIVVSKKRSRIAQESGSSD